MRHKLFTLLNPTRSVNSNLTGLKLCALLLLGLGLSGLQAQESVNATGGEASGSGGSVSYSVGQMVYTTNQGTNGSVAQGVQQPFEISVVVGIEEANDIQLLVSAYPNPSTDYLTLEVKDFKLSTVRYAGKAFAKPKDYKQPNEHCYEQSEAGYLFCKSNKRKQGSKNF